MSISNSIKTLISVVSYYADNPKISTFFIIVVNLLCVMRVRYLVGFDPPIARTYS